MAAVLKALCFVLLLVLTNVTAYVPALPTNSSKTAREGGTDVTDTSKLHLRWFPNGLYSQNISYQLAGAESQGISKGALVHFSEGKASNMTPPTGTPWIAMISCDGNATNASDEEDVFTLARDKGAKAALLYSLYSLACVINPEYTDPQTFDQVFDIFSTQSLTSAHLIEYQFGQLSTNQSIYWAYDSQLLNNSASVVQSTIEQGTPPSPSYLFAILQASNATGSIDDPILNGTNTNSLPTSNGSSPNTALAMIILYAITGCVSALFCIVIVSGAIRAIRNPERYGPRRNGNGLGQSRARGITRAILDTFPVVKFGGNNNTTPQNDVSSQSEVAKDVENPSENHAVELREWEVVDQRAGTASPCDAQISTPAIAQLDSNIEDKQGIRIPDLAHQKKDGPASPRRGLYVNTDVNAPAYDNGEGTSLHPPPILRNKDEVVPSAIGRETCPICIMDFEEGDDLRLLPCEGKHRFHQSCVDPWLLELSSSCPICRQDFLALENMLSGESELGHEQYDEHEYDHRRSRALDAAGNRFSRYLRFAKRRHRRGHGEEEPDPTDPYMPPAPESPTTTERPNPPT